MDDIKWFLGFMLIIGMVWLTGKSAGPEQPARTATTTPQSRTVSPAKKAPIKQNTPPKGTVPVSTPGNIISETILPSFSSDPNISYLHGKIFIGALRRSSSAKTEYVILQASSRNTEAVPITGLTLKSKISFMGQEIPKAWSLPFPGYGEGGEIVMLRPGQTAYIISGRSPNGQSFQLNRCTGYFEQGMNFVPSLPLECPHPAVDHLPPPPNTLSDACITYLNKLGRCRVPPSTVPPQLKADGNCQAYLFNNINYNQCVTYHKEDPNFFRGSWHIYLNRNTPLWRMKRETVELFDENGRLVDTRNY